MTDHQPWYRKQEYIVLALLALPPAGIYLAWAYSGWSKPVKIGATLLSSLVLLTVIGGAQPASELAEEEAAPSAIAPVSSGPLPQVKQEEYGERWPFTVASGRLQCEMEKSEDGQWVNRMVILESNGAYYAVNGSAMSKSGKLGYEDLRPLEEIWRDNPEGGKVNPEPLIERGLKFCEE